MFTMFAYTSYFDYSYQTFIESFSHALLIEVSADKDKLVTILVDCLAAASTKVEMDADFDKRTKGYLSVAFPTMLYPPIAGGGTMPPAHGPGQDRR